MAGRVGARRQRVARMAEPAGRPVVRGVCMRCRVHHYWQDVTVGAIGRDPVKARCADCRLTLVVSRVGRALALQQGNQPAINELLAETPTRFFQRGSNVIISFEGDGGTIDRLNKAKLAKDNPESDITFTTSHVGWLYANDGLCEKLDLSKIPNFSQASESPRFTKEGQIDGKTYAVPKNWGTTGFSVNTSKIKTKLSSWKDFFEIAQTEGDGRTMVHDYQLTTIGSALVSLIAEASGSPRLIERVEDYVRELKSACVPTRT